MISTYVLGGIIALGVIGVYSIYYLSVKIYLHFKGNPNDVPSEYSEKRIQCHNDEKVAIEENSKNVSEIEVDIIECSDSKDCQNYYLTKMLSHALSTSHPPISNSATIVNIQEVDSEKSNIEHENSSNSSDITLVFDVPNKIYS